MNAYVATVFGAPAGIGSLTGVVRSDAEVEPQRAQQIAAKLGFPDTVFVWPTESGHWAARFYSPVEPLTVCYQALIAAACVLEKPLSAFALRDRTLSVEVTGEMGWVLTPATEVVRKGVCTGPQGLASEVIDTGRARAYARVPTDVFERFSLPAEDAQAWLASQRLSGFCLVCMDGPQIRLRVFTSSLSGREDMATGGAAAALPAFLALPGPFVVQQGIGSQRGELHVVADSRGVCVGGRCELVIAGRLLIH
ncbi:MAG TPA: PhzF family phenazine biosynthesis protein [Polyangiales bacterium]